MKKVLTNHEGPNVDHDDGSPNRPWKTIYQANREILTGQKIPDVRCETRSLNKLIRIKCLVIIKF